MMTSFCYDYSIKGKRVITFEGERTVQDIIQFAEKANRYMCILTGTVTEHCLVDIDYKLKKSVHKG